MQGTPLRKSHKQGYKQGVFALGIHATDDKGGGPCASQLWSPVGCLLMPPAHARPARHPYGVTSVTTHLILGTDIPNARQALDAVLRRHGSEAGGAFFLGGRYSFAETSASPFVRRLLVVLPHYRSYDAAAIAAERLPRLHAWIEVRQSDLLR